MLSSKLKSIETKNTGKNMVDGGEQDTLECIRERFSGRISLQMVYRKYYKQPRKKKTKPGNEAKRKDLSMF